MSSQNGFADLEDSVQHCEVLDVPINFTTKIEEGSYSIVYKHIHMFRNKRKQFSKKKMLEVAFKLRKLRDVNIARSRGYSLRLCAFYFEYCELILDDLLVHNVSQLIEILIEKDHFLLFTFQYYYA